MTDASRYNIVVRRVVDTDGDYYEARIRELPDLTEYADSAIEAYDLAIDAISTVAKIFAEKGKKMPPPIESDDEYSGRVTLRLPKSLHRALAEEAAEEDVSLNQHLVNVLSYFSGFAHAEKASSMRWTAARAPTRGTHLKVVQSKPLQTRYSATPEVREWPMAANS